MAAVMEPRFSGAIDSLVQPIRLEEFEGWEMLMPTITVISQVETTLEMITTEETVDQYSDLAQWDTLDAE